MGSRAPSAAARSGGPCRQIRDAEARPSVEHHFKPEEPNRPWVGGSELFALLGGRVVYFSFVIDVFSRKVVGWQLASHMRPDLVLVRCGWYRGRVRRARTSGSIAHTDSGSQYAWPTTPKSLDYNCLLGYVGSVGDATRTPMAESFVDSFKTELIADGAWRSRSPARVRRLSNTSPGSTTPACMKASGASRLSIRRPPRPTVQSNHSMNNKSEPTNPVSVEPGLAQGRPR